MVRAGRKRVSSPTAESPYAKFYGRPYSTLRNQKYNATQIAPASANSGSGRPTGEPEEKEKKNPVALKNAEEAKAKRVRVPTAKKAAADFTEPKVKRVKVTEFKEPKAVRVRAFPVAWKNAEEAKVKRVRVPTAKKTTTEITEAKVKRVKVTENKEPKPKRVKATENKEAKAERVRVLAAKKTAMEITEAKAKRVKVIENKEPKAKRVRSSAAKKTATEIPHVLVRAFTSPLANVTPAVYNLPEQLRLACRDQTFTKQTSGQCAGYAQANICILPKEYAFDFLLFCQRNPKSCPLLHVIEAGNCTLPSTRHAIAATSSSSSSSSGSSSRKRKNVAAVNDIDVRTDLPRYRIYRNGVLDEEVTDVTQHWQDDFVTFVIGCSFSFEDALINAGLSIRHQETLDRTVPMYQTNIPCLTAGNFDSNLVVSMRPFTAQDAIRAVEITSRYPRVHGAPVHIGDPSAIGISKLNKPDYGDSVIVHKDEVPVFWACGVTPQAAVQRSKPRLCITHSPGHMLVLDQKNEELSN